MKSHDFINSMDEANPVEKKHLGAGVDHTVYPSLKDPRIVYKLGSDYAVQGWFSLFKENPDLFQKYTICAKHKCV